VAKFQLGRLYCTAGAALKDDTPEFDSFVWQALARYTEGDWGELSTGDKAQNDAAIADTDGGRILAAYENKKHPAWKIWIITESDRSVTTVLFPDEY